jgi:hypothetical protein
MYNHSKLLIFICLILMTVPFASHTQIEFSDLEPIKSGSSEYERIMSAIIDLIGDTQATLSELKESEKKQNVKAVLEKVAGLFTDRKIRLLRTSDDKTGILRHIERGRVTYYAFIVEKNFERKIKDDPYYMQGAIVHEFNHIADTMIYGIDHKFLKITKESESRALNIQADFYSILTKCEFDSMSARLVKPLMEAYKEAFKGEQKDPSKWNHLLSRMATYDIDILARYETETYFDLAIKNPMQIPNLFYEMAIPDGDSVLNEMEALLNKADSIEDEPDSEKCSYFWQMDDLRLKIRAFLWGSSTLSKAIMAKYVVPTDEMRSAQDKWAVIYNDIVDRSSDAQVILDEFSNICDPRD